jgi:hypothetical protein
MKHEKARVIRTVELANAVGLNRSAEFAQRQMDAMPGRKEQKFLVFVTAKDNAIHHYPVFYSPGFTEALQHALNLHRRISTSRVQCASVFGSSGKVLELPDAVVQAMAMGARVLITNRLSNK